jgi:hypothetical protein
VKQGSSLDAMSWMRFTDKDRQIVPVFFRLRQTLRQKLAQLS